MSLAPLAALCIGQFLTALVIAFFVLFAELLEGYSVGGGRRAIQKLLDALPRRVTVRRDGHEQERDAEDVAPGETILVRPGERILRTGWSVKATATWTNRATVRYCSPVTASKTPAPLARRSASKSLA